MPIPEPFRVDREAFLNRIARLHRRFRRPRPRKGGQTEPEPVEPPNPRNLSGGAAAELEYDD